MTINRWIILTICLSLLLLNLQVLSAQSNSSENKSTSANEKSDSRSGYTGPSASSLLAKQKDYKTGDLLTWEIVSPVFQEMRKNGAELPKSSELKPLFLSQSDSFSKMLRSPNGQQFFNDLSRHPASIDCADRFRSLGGSDKEMQFIIDRKGGAQYFTDMVDNKKGQLTAKLLTARSTDKKFDQPTGKIYLESQLSEYLSSLSDAEESAPAKTTPRTGNAEKPRLYDQ